MNRKKSLAAVLLLCTVFGFTACGTKEQTKNGVTTKKVDKQATTDITNVHLRDKKSLYDKDHTKVTTMYLTVRRGDATENQNHSWSEVNQYSVEDYQKMHVKRYQVAGLLQVGNEDGPVSGELGYDQDVPNASVQIRGESSSKNAQKNYKIKIKKNKGEWNGQRTININKHQTEALRFRNKLSYDLMEEIPQLMGARTSFVHLYVKDETSDNPSGKFEDYGLYTQVEQINKNYLKDHGLDENANLYKPNFFEFFRYEDTIVYGVTEPVLEDQKDIMAYFRRGEKQDILVIGNFRDEAAEVEIPELKGKTCQVLLNNGGTCMAVDGRVKLEALQGVVFEIK